MPCSVLIADHDPVLRQMLARELDAGGFTAVVQTPGRDVAEMLLATGAEILVLGTLPDGVRRTALIAALRDGTMLGEPDATPVVVLGEANLLETLRCLDAGADDVVARDVSYLELRARLRAIHRRMTAHVTRALLHVGPLTVNVAAGAAWFDGAPIHLTRSEMALLVKLASDPDRVWTKAELDQELWGSVRGLNSRRVDTFACRLRRKFIAAGSTEGWVCNVRGEGYRLLEHPRRSRAAR